ncbi:MAG: DUF4426 domain-containing protein [Pseudomonadales bacterium]|nr:DUF4426 domain-containing protein [Pseudomonadales bacterium]
MPMTRARHTLNTCLLSLIVLYFLPVFFFSAQAKGIEQTHHDAGSYRIHYSVFNSRFISENTAAALGIVRSPSEAIVTIASTRKRHDEGSAMDSYSLGLKAEVTGNARNLMQQSYPLTFTPVEENGVIYYLARLDHINEEVFHFDIRVLPLDEEGATPITFSFSRKLHIEND